MKTIWIYTWAYIFVGLELLDKLWDRAAKLFDRLVAKNWLVAALFAVNLWLVFKMAGWL